MDRLQKLLDNLASQKPIKQAIVAVESGDRSFRWSGVAGKTDVDGVPISADTPFFIASIDKLYNAAIVMLLSEQGKLDLDAPLTACLPARLVRGLHVLDRTDYTDQITIRHLLSHTSGLADWLEDSPKNGQSLIEQVLEKGDMTLTFEDIAEIARAQLKPHFPPQDASTRRPKVRYSDTNYILLIALIEAVCGQPLHQVHEEMLYKPLGLNHTYFPGFSQPLGPTPAAVPLRADGQVIQTLELMKSFRGIYSTTGDTIAFLRKLTHNVVFQKEETFAQMQVHWNRFGFPMDRAAVRAPGWPIEYGLGLMRFQLPRVFTSLKLLPAVIGHTGSTGCWLFWCPEMDMFFSGTVNEVSAGAVPYRIIPKMLRILQD
jgi:D-alanyl-D-alanine carboxypeptidase